MKQVLQNLKTGETTLVEVPWPNPKPGHVLIRTRATLISAGTERMLVDFGKSGYLAKAKSQPDKVKQVLDKVKADGLASTIRAVQAKLDQPLALGYCNVGTVVGDERTRKDADRLVGEAAPLEHAAGDALFRAGERVASNGPHAELVCVPKNLCVKVPDAVSDDEAAFTVLGAIGLQGVRLAQPTLGEFFGVIGLGLIGLLTVQILRANGCRVLGVDPDPARCELARSFGAEVVNPFAGGDPIASASFLSGGRGLDGVLIAAATSSVEPVRHAAEMCRKRGRIVLVGVTGLELRRSDFYEKELSFQVSCSYGPGRYDREYEETGRDYPLPYVRWTEQRNFEAILDLMAAGSMNVKPLISHRFRIEQAESAYRLLSERQPCLGILLEYEKNHAGPMLLEEQVREKRTVQFGQPVRTEHASGPAVVGFIGAGNYAGQVLMPAFRGTGAVLKSVATSSGLSGTHLGKKFGFRETTTDTERLFLDPDIDTIVVATPHDSHARFVCKALAAGKNVFVEKPLCVTYAELDEIAGKYRASEQSPGRTPLLMVGFNRRFAPQVVKMKSLLANVKEPKSFIMTVNAGKIPASHWTQDPDIGGGRIIGEACHFVDLLRFLAGAPVTGVQATGAGGDGDAPRDKVTFTLTFADGSFGTVHYLSNGNKSFPKERLEVFCAGRILQLDNFRKMTGYGWRPFRKMNLWRQDKGHALEVSAFVHAVRNGVGCPIPFDEIIEVTKTTLDISRMIGVLD